MTCSGSQKGYCFQYHLRVYVGVFAPCMQQCVQDNVRALDVEAAALTAFPSVICAAIKMP